MPNTKNPETPKPSALKILKFCIGLSLFLGLAAAALVATQHYQWPTTSSPTATSEEKARVPDPTLYAELVQQSNTKRTSLAENYKTASTSKKKQIIMEARHYLENHMPKMMRCWLGTPWDFSGTSQTPGEGKIACGYFVSVILRDAGFRVNRVRLAQQPSKHIILTMLGDNKTQVIKHKLSYDKFLKQFKNLPEGIYIIGLDRHVGYLTNFGGKMRFLHSVKPEGVVDESEEQAWAVEYSRYRVIGNLTLQDSMIKKWLLGQEFPTREWKKKG